MIPRPDPVPTCTVLDPYGNGLTRCGDVAAADTDDGPRCEDHLTKGDYRGLVRRYAPAKPAPVEVPVDADERDAAERAAYQRGRSQGTAEGLHEGRAQERARIAKLVREQACEEARIKQSHEARAADFDQQANNERDKAERHDERREALCRLHDLIAKEDE